MSSSNDAAIADPEKAVAGGQTARTSCSGGISSSSATETDADNFVVDWEGGDDDPLCPRSFHSVRKWLIVMLVSSASFGLTCASSIYTSTYTQMERDFHSSRIDSLAGLTIFVTGIGLGPLFLSPMSEFYGRRPIYLISWTLYILLILPQALAPNIAAVVVNRFLDGFAGSAFLTVAGGTVGDLFPKSDLQLPMVVYAITPFIGPCAGPLIGGFINYYSSWRWTYYFSLILSGVIWLGIVLFVPETYHPVLLRQKARKLRESTGDNRWAAPGEAELAEKSVLRAVSYSLRRPFQLLFYEPMCLNLCVYSMILLGILYLFFGAFPLVFETVYGMNLWQVGLTFLGLAIGMCVAAATDPIWHRIRTKLVRRLENETGIKGASEPEFRLVPSILGGVLVPAGIFVFAWSSYPWVHWIVPIIGCAIFGAGMFLVFSSIFTFLVDAYPLYAASAMAANAFLRCCFGGTFPLFGNRMYERLGIHWATSLLAFLTVLMMPFPYIFFRYGKKIRAKSRYAKH